MKAPLSTQPPPVNVIAPSAAVHAHVPAKQSLPIDALDVVFTDDEVVSIMI